jgi:uncharacterized protein (DUF58 family)
VSSASDPIPAASEGEPGPAPVRPAERYGDHRRGWRPLGIIAVVGLAIVFVGGVLAIGWRLSNPPFSVQLRAYEVTDDRTVEVTYLVRTKDPSNSVTCVVRARDREGNEVGRTTNVSATGRDEQVLQVTLRTSARAVLGEVVECRITP